MSTKIHEEEGNAPVRHWNGEDSEPLVKLKVYGTPAAPGAAAVPGLITEGTIYTRLADVPAPFKEFCEKYAHGRQLDLKDKTKSRKLTI